VVQYKLQNVKFGKSRLPIIITNYFCGNKSVFAALNSRSVQIGRVFVFFADLPAFNKKKRKSRFVFLLKEYP